MLKWKIITCYASSFTSIPQSSALFQAPFLTTTTQPSTTWYCHMNMERCVESYSPIPANLISNVNQVVNNLWNNVSLPSNPTSNMSSWTLQGEAIYPPDMPYTQRLSYFLDQSQKGDASAQHSAGLLLWSGYCHCHRHCHDKQRPVESIMWHGAAACQGHLDSLAILGGCLRKGIGIQRNVLLGLSLIEYVASVGNPSGVNKKAAMMEDNNNFIGALQLYEDSLKHGKTNALLLFNLGHLLLHGNDGVLKEISRGEELLRLAVDLAPDEGSEEAAYFLYHHLKQDQHQEAMMFLRISASLGYPESIKIIEF